MEGRGNEGRVDLAPKVEHPQLKFLVASLLIYIYIFPSVTNSAPAAPAAYFLFGLTLKNGMDSH